MSIFVFYLYNIQYVQATASCFFSLFFLSFPFCGRFQVEFGFQTGLAQSVVSLTAHHRLASLIIIIDFLLKLLLFGLLVVCYACMYICST